jgi:hypothetical protein
LSEFISLFFLEHAEKFIPKFFKMESSYISKEINQNAPERMLSIKNIIADNLNCKVEYKKKNFLK